MRNTWYQKAIIYSLDMETFYDSDADGIGDIQGLITKLGYIASLGINCIWLLPFYPSPDHDNGYDVMDYYNIDPKFGTLGDFAELVYKADHYGIRIIIDLVVNHTSSKHPWFKEARKSRQSPYRDYYVWSDEPLAFGEDILALSGEENTIWTYDKTAGQYYLHRFYKEQPDLNIANPAVRTEIIKIMGFWLQMGVSGFRIDAAEMLIEPYGMNTMERAAVTGILDEMRAYLDARKSDAILLAEANINPDKVAIYLQEGKRMHLLFNFFVNQHLFLSLAEKNPRQLIKALEKLPAVNANQWLQFLRHHDELSLKLLTDKQKEKVLECFAPEPEMRIYNNGIRRRLAPMLQWNEALMKMALSLLFSLPGIPLLRYGDEIGMADDLSLAGRESVRSPMQWANRPNGGFSTAPEKKMKHHVITGAHGYETINVLDAINEPTSFLNWVKQLIGVRKQCQEIIEERLELIHTDHKAVVAFTYRDEKHQLLLLHNLSDMPVVIQKKELNMQGIPVYSLLNDEPIAAGLENIAMGSYAYKWFKIFL
jgi:maltose alpha-D-glucosyltransferase / alpha-amylase